MKPLISDSLKESLVTQLAEENKNANLYLSIASYLNGKGLSNLAKRFEEQHSEEISHGLIIYNLLSDLSVVFTVPEIESYDISLIDSIYKVGELYLEREVITTESLDEIKKQAIDENNPVVEERIRLMIQYQQSEYKEATEFRDTTILFSEWWQVALWNASLGKER